MPLECSILYSNGIVGSNSIVTRVDTSAVIQLEHTVSAPVDQQTGQRRGSRVHSPIVVTKELDKATPLLYQAVCQATVLPTILISWYRITAEGTTEVYYTIELTEAVITHVESILPNTREVAQENMGHLEKIHIQYRTIVWTWVDGGIMFEDDWRQSAA